eukprot:CAMPEP_0181253398 /NCGR_PEP_ID=MMETSP1096-20121128/47993_1 /TAXON_ID=156174 ORGANISM="Chrysochromulina ericina, Strain CCMP281" /NCGR_SAMPLE_ID=MMETSP1096 /ASSEMBLY_ACC=CAM_ASM_000453 /LENGTH=78 /DNA_ID=CAMNT_0023351253 /DNA_START=718 /DNA_END=954 /DNA_ORIENTATION=-
MEDSALATTVLQRRLRCVRHALGEEGSIPEGVGRRGNVGSLVDKLTSTHAVLERHPPTAPLPVHVNLTGLTRACDDTR